MAAFVEMLGETLQSKEGNVATAVALEGKTAVVLYFAAGWCSSCQKFTPKFVKWYNDDLRAKGLEVVFICADEHEHAHSKYYAEMPWLALPFSEGDRMQAVSEKFHRRGIPSVVVLSPDGRLITTDGDLALEKDPTGNNLPWWQMRKMMKLPQALADAKVIAPGGEVQDFTSLSGKAIALYFGGQWSEHCQTYVAKFASWYNSDLKDKGLDVVYVSSDKDEDAFKAYFAAMPWFALPYSDGTTRELVTRRLGITTVPSLVILLKDGTVINKDALFAVAEDQKGENFPWNENRNLECCTLQ